MTSKLFTPLALGPQQLQNRIVVAPMCQYSAIDGLLQHWHQVHLGTLAMSGAGLLILEATGVSAEARITPGCLGLYNNDHAAALKQQVENLRSLSDTCIGIQLAHAGRKASSSLPWQGGDLIAVADGGWQTVAPSALPQKPGETEPLALDAAGLNKVRNDFQRAAERARDCGFDLVEIHMAHGYLMHQFLSPVANQRTDEYGGSLENRLRLPLEVFDIVRAACSDSMSVGIRLSAYDWVADGWDVAQSIELSKALQSRGCNFIHVSSGGVAHEQKIALEPGYQVPFARDIKAALNIPVIAVGLITEPQQAEQIVANGEADAIALARGLLNDPRWPWRAAAELGGTVNAPSQYWRCLPGGTPRIFGDTVFGAR